MSHDRSSDSFDASLSALYDAHLGAGADAKTLPSAAADARIRALATDLAGALPSARPIQGPAIRRPSESGWRSWIGAAWFKPSLAFATLASLSVVIVALMPRDDMNIERAEPAPSAPAQPSATQSATTPSAAQLPSPNGAPASAGGPASTTATAKARAAETDRQPARLKAASPSSMSADAARPNKDARTLETQHGTTAGRMVPASEVAVESGSRKSVSEPSVAKAAPALAAPQPNPFPGSSSTPTERRADRPAESARASAPASPPAPAVAPPPPPSSPMPAAGARQSTTLGGGASDAAASQQRIEKPSNLPESEYRGNTPPLPEVRDSAPTYPNEVHSSIPLPNTYNRSPRTHVRDSQQAAAASTLAQKPAGAPARKEETLQKRSFEGPPSMASTAPLPRDPAEWIKIILKLRADGKTDQVTKELVEFRKQFPAYALPDELKALAPK